MNDAILLRLRKYCALRERSVKEVRNKIIEIGVEGEEYITSLLEKLTKEGFLNEKRYVSAFASGKFRNKKWGKRKIEMELKKQQISDTLLERGLNEISNEDYINTLDDLLKKKWKVIVKSNDEVWTSDHSGHDIFSPQIQKLMNYALQKGYEFELIVSRVKELKIV